MSFKREGDDKNLLGVLRQRRIKDLLSEDIPEDEATLLSNGRFACTVCSWKPVFDTVNMLSIHRSGKKHKASAVIHEQKKQELRNLILERKHQQFLKDGTTDIQQASVSHRGLGCGKPYDPRVKKAKSKPYDRKARVDLDGPSSEDLYPLTSIETMTSSLLPGNRSHNSCQKQGHHHGNQKSVVRETPETVSAKLEVQKNVPAYKRKADFILDRPDQSEGPLVHPNNLKKIRDGYTCTDKISHIRPYESKLKRKDTHVQATDNEHTKSVGTTSVLPLPSVTPPVSSPLSSVLSNYKKDHRIRIDLQNPKAGKVKKGTVQSCSSSGVKADVRVNVDHEKSIDTSSIKGKDNSSLPLETKSGDTTATSEKCRSQKIQQLRGAGWKRDWDGKWIRDEDAEFDSDEEPPDL